MDEKREAKCKTVFDDHRRMYATLKTLSAKAAIRHSFCCIWTWADREPRIGLHLVLRCRIALVCRAETIILPGPVDRSGGKVV